jgi:hypothetical protein
MSVRGAGTVLCLVAALMAAAQVLVDGAESQELATFNAGIGGAAIAQALGPLRRQ